MRKEEKKINPLRQSSKSGRAIFHHSRYREDKKKEALRAKLDDEVRLFKEGKGPYAKKGPGVITVLPPEELLPSSKVGGRHAAFEPVLDTHFST